MNLKEYQYARKILSAHIAALDESESRASIEDFTLEDYLAIGVGDMLYNIEVILKRNPNIKPKVDIFLEQIKKMGQEK